MGITVISPPVAASGGIASIGTLVGAQSLPDNVLPIDFAALLINQISGLQTGTVSPPEVPISVEKAGDEDIPEIISELLSAQDPSLNPPLNPALNPQTLLPRIPPALTLPEATEQNGKVIPTSGFALSTIDKALEKTGFSEKEGWPNSFTATPKTAGSAAFNIQASAAQGATPAAIASGAADAAILAAGNNSSGNTPPSFASAMALSSTAPTESAPTQLAPTQLAPTQLAPTQSAASVPSSIATPLQDSRWPQDFGDRVVWMAKSDQQHAQININPPQLGPVQITVSLNGDQASIAFASPHAEVRKAIEDAMPNLREMLASSGINLGQSDVGSELKQQQRELAREFANGQRLTGETAILPADARLGSKTSGQLLQQGRGLVDLFA